MALNTIKYRMSPEDFITWKGVMCDRGLASNEAECGEAIGRTRWSVMRAKKVGADYLTALACAAALKRLKHYVPNEEAA